jgi:predicted nucleotidyltransferase
MVQKEIIDKIFEFKKLLIKNKIKVNEIILYGSQVTGTYHKDSDIDVAVVSSSFGKDRFEEGVKLFELAVKVDPRIEPVPISTKSYRYDTWIPLIYEIRTKGLDLNTFIS